MRNLLLILAILMVFFSNGYASDNATPSGIPFSKLEPELDSFITKYLYKTTPGVAVIITKGSEIIFSKGYGYADIDKKIAVDPNATYFEYGSVTKTFVWVAAMQLVESGKLSLDKDIKEYLPAEFVKELRYSDTITMFDLMNHTSGFEENLLDIAFKDKSDYLPLRDYLLVAEPKQIYKPGSIIAYSNYGASLAAYVIECITGKPFYQYVEQNIFMRADMNTVVIDPLYDKDDLFRNAAQGYGFDKNKKLIKIDRVNILPYPAGGARGTALDLAKFARALTASDNSSNMLTNSPAIVDYLFSQSYTPDLRISSVAHGFWEYQGKVRGVGHLGNTISFSSLFYLFPEEKLSVTVLTNAVNEMDITYGVLELLAGVPGKTLVDTELPESSILEGEYMFARKNESSLLSFLNYLSTFKIKSISENEITGEMMGFTEKFHQVSPYLYELAPTSNMLARLMFKRIVFKVENDKVVNISSGQISDLLPVSEYKQKKYMILYAVLLGIAILFFAIAPFLMIVRMIATRFERYKDLHAFIHLFLVFAGTALLVNNILIFDLLLTFKNTYILHSSTLAPYLLSNKIIAAVGVVIAIAGIFNWSKKTVGVKRKVSYLLTVIIFAVFVALLFIWNFIKF